MSEYYYQLPRRSRPTVQLVAAAARCRRLRRRRKEERPPADRVGPCGRHRAGTGVVVGHAVGVAVEQHDQCPAERWLVQWLERLGLGQLRLGQHSGGSSSSSGTPAQSTGNARSTPSRSPHKSTGSGRHQHDLSYQGAQAAGTGMVLTSNGEILTNNHVIDGATTISVTDLGNNKTYTASVVGYDVTGDVAVLQLKNASGLTTVNLGNSSSVSVGEAIVGIGNAGGTGGTPAPPPARSPPSTSRSPPATRGPNSEQLSGLIESNADNPAR